jgi:hypothetical protein
MSRAKLWYLKSSCEALFWSTSGAVRSVLGPRRVSTHDEPLTAAGEACEDFWSRLLLTRLIRTLIFVVSRSCTPM